MSRISDLERRTNISRRDFLCRGTLLAFLAGCAPINPVNAELYTPHVIYGGSLRNDFWGIHQYNQRVGLSGRYDPPGLNISYKYGAEVYAPTKGKVLETIFN